MSKKNRFFQYITKSGFVKSVFMRILPIFITASIAIAAIGFFSFTSEIKKNMLSDRQKQLKLVENTISTRMEEVNSIAYNISIDDAFYIGAASKSEYTGYEMSSTLERYLVGNSFIEHLAFYRKSEPDKIYVSSGERSLTEFFCTSFGLDKSVAEENIKIICSTTETAVRAIMYGSEENSFFAYLYPLPQLSENPQAFVMMLIPMDEVTPLFASMLTNEHDGLAVFDADGEEIYRTGSVSSEFPLKKYTHDNALHEEHLTFAGTSYIVQKTVSATNGWTYLSVIRASDTLSGLANKQLVFIILLLLLVFIAMIAMFVSIIVQYKPISNLAAAVSDDSRSNVGGRGRVDEREILSNTIATLKDDSEQKQHYEDAYREAAAASQAKSAFLSNMSHDIRTPLNAIIGMTAIAYKHADNADYTRECLNKVQVSSKYLLDIINNVLDMSRIESGRITLSNEKINLVELIEGIVALLEPELDAKSQHLSVNIGTVDCKNVVGDSIRLTQAFVNILSNSIKFTDVGGKIAISMHQVNDENDDGFADYEFIFTDNGIGMSPEFVSQVFDTFSRAKGAVTANIEGTGLGMAIAKNLIELMGGAIKCESELGKGTEFTVTMHMKTENSENVAAAISQLTSGVSGLASNDSEEVRFDGKHILLVEDNVINREIARNIISETGARVTEAVDGKAAFELFQANASGYFDLILMDIQMPVMNGYEATAAIRALERPDAQTIPIYAMTANTFDEDVRQVKDAGMNGHIGKPYTPTTLYKTLKQALEK